MPKGIYIRTQNKGWFKKGNSGFDRKHTKKSKIKISVGLKGIKRTEEFKQKLRKNRSGDKSNLWKGGITPENKRLRNIGEYKEWRMAVFTRDNFTCQFCGMRGHIGLGKSVYLEAHHIKSFSQYPELRFDINNGITLCIECHNLTKKDKDSVKIIKKYFPHIG